MNCEPYEELFTGWINSELKPAGRERLEQHLADCKACREELADLQQMWNDLGQIETPEPSAQMQVNFETMLADFKENEARSNLWNKTGEAVANTLKWRPEWPFAYQLAIILVSFACGYVVFNMGKGGKQDRQLAELSTQVHDLKQTMMLALLENPSASERIKAVSYTTQIRHADQQVVEALLATLNNDPNVNVRLSTLDALTHMANYPEVREGLIRSVSQQDSPIMQAAIADVMLKLQEKRSVKQFKELLKQKGLDTTVRDKIKSTIKSLI